MAKIKFGGKEFILDGSGAAFMPKTKTLIFSDLHFEKGSFFTKAGRTLPPFDTMETLFTIKGLVEKYQPQEILCLGDSFHDRKAISRMKPEDLELMRQVVASVKVWNWVEGNHDYQMPDLPGGNFLLEHLYDNLLFTHKPQMRNEFQICGHFHPSATLNIADNRVKGACFVLGENVMIMPAMGAFTGGMDIKSPQIMQVSGKKREIYFLYGNRVFNIPFKD